MWPIEERPVPQSDVPGEKTSPTQPFPTKPPAYARNYLKVPDDLIDFTPELRAQALKNIARYKVGPWMYNPPVLGSVNGLLGAINMGNAVGGTNWPGVAYDPETHTAFAQREQRRHHVGLAGAAAAELLGHPLRVRHRRPAVPRKCSDRATAARPIRRARRRKPRRSARPPRPASSAPAAAAADAPTVGGGAGGGLLVDGSDDSQAALRHDLRDQPRSRRDRLAGARTATRRTTSAIIRRCKGLTIPKTGQAGTGGIGLMVTKTLVVMGDPQLTTTPEHPRGAMLRAYDKSDGQGSRRGLDGGAAERLADDLPRRRQAVHRRRDQRRQLLGRVRRVHAAGAVRRPL